VLAEGPNATSISFRLDPDNNAAASIFAYDPVHRIITTTSGDVRLTCFGAVALEALWQPCGFLMECSDGPCLGSTGAHPPGPRDNVGVVHGQFAFPDKTTCGIHDANVKLFKGAPSGDVVLNGDDTQAVPVVVDRDGAVSFRTERGACRISNTANNTESAEPHYPVVPLLMCSWFTAGGESYSCFERGACANDKCRHPPARVTPSVQPTMPPRPSDKPTKPITSAKWFWPAIISGAALVLIATVFQGIIRARRRNHDYAQAGLNVQAYQVME
jgi:hypothetical protein